MYKLHRRHILVIMATVQKARHDKLSGIYDYAHRQDWIVQTIEDTSGLPMLEATLKARTVDGIISDGFNAPVKLKQSDRKGIPIVYIDKPYGARQMANCVNNDDDACARLAAQTLAKLGLRQYATVGTFPSSYWSKSRMRTFAESIKALGLRCESFKPSGCVSKDIQRLRDWMTRLPRPCGLFAVTDAVAKRCIDLLTDAGIRVPDEIAVIGIDNNELICEHTTPSITSILPGFRQAGRIASERLHRLMEGIGCDDLPTTYEPQAVIRRGSTARTAIRQEKIPEILEFIRRNACHGIRVTDVIAFAGLPKSTLELHFRLATTRSIVQEIQRVRLEEVERLLSESNCPIGMIAAQCGFQNDNYLKNLFKRTHGQTLSQYRAAAALSITRRSIMRQR